MKKLYTLLLILNLVTGIAKSQTGIYHPFPDSNAIWTEHTQYCCVSDCPPPPSPNPLLVDIYFSYYLQGDTIINAVWYHKLYHSLYSIHQHCAIGGSIDFWETQ